MHNTSQYGELPPLVNVMAETLDCGFAGIFPRGEESGFDMTYIYFAGPQSLSIASVSPNQENALYARGKPPPYKTLGSRFGLLMSGAVFLNSGFQLLDAASGNTDIYPTLGLTAASFLAMRGCWRTVKSTYNTIFQLEREQAEVVASIRSLKNVDLDVFGLGLPDSLNALVTVPDLEHPGAYIDAKARANDILEVTASPLTGVHIHEDTSGHPDRALQLNLYRQIESGISRLSSPRSQSIYLAHTVRLLSTMELKQQNLKQSSDDILNSPDYRESALLEAWLTHSLKIIGCAGSLALTEAMLRFEEEISLLDDGLGKAMAVEKLRNLYNGADWKDPIDSSWNNPLESIVSFLTRLSIKGSTQSPNPDN